MNISATPNHSDPPILIAKSPGEMKPTKQTISKMSRPKNNSKGTLGGRRDRREAHILIVIHGEMMHIERQNRK